MPEFNRERRLRTRSVAGTLALGELLVEMLPAPKLIVLRGDLGAGKTTLVKGMAVALGAANADEVLSPTFTLVHEFSSSTSTVPGPAVRLIHLDLYRLEEERELEGLGFWEMAETPGVLMMVEWGDRFKSVMERADGEIHMEIGDADTERLLRVRWRD